MGKTRLRGYVRGAVHGAGGKKKFLPYCGVISGARPIEEIESFKANDTAVTFNGAGAVTSGTFAGRMWQAQRLGASTDTVMNAPSGSGSVPEWDGAHLMTGYAAIRWALQYDPDKYPTGTPKPQWVIKGVKAYDPRLDSTYDGGSGSHRIDDEDTWEWKANPWLHALPLILAR